MNARLNSNGTNTNVGTNVNLSPAVSLGSNVQTSTLVGADLPGVDLNLKNNLKTTLALNSPLDLNLPLLP